MPPQDFTRGEVRIAVAPGYYDEILIDNATKIQERTIRRELGSVKVGAPVERKALERAVWLIGDLANAEAKTTLKAGAQPGTTTLILHVKPKGNPTWGYLGFDNGGYRYTGRYEYSALVNWGNLAKEGDILSASLLYTGQGQTGGSLSYTSPIWNQGSRIGVSYARSTYHLGGIFEAMGATGTADTLSLSYQKNFLRSREANLYGTIRFDSKRLHDDLDFFGQNGRKSAHNWVAEVNGDTLDHWLGGGANTYSLSYTYGDLNIKDAISRLLDTPAFGGLDTDRLVRG